MQEVYSTPDLPRAPSKAHSRTLKTGDLNSPTPSRSERLRGKGSSYGLGAHQQADSDDEDDGAVFDGGMDTCFNDEPNLGASDVPVPPSSIMRPQQTVANMPNIVELNDKSHAREDEDRVRQPIHANLPKSLSQPCVYTNFDDEQDRHAQVIDIEVPQNMYQYRHVIQGGLSKAQYRDILEDKINEEMRIAVEGEQRIEEFARRTLQDTPTFQARSMVLGSRLGQSKYIKKDDIVRFMNMAPEEEVLAARSLRTAADFLLYHALPRECEVVGAAAFTRTRERFEKEEAAHNTSSKEDMEMCEELELEESTLELDEDQNDERVGSPKGKEPMQAVERQGEPLDGEELAVSNKRKASADMAEEETVTKKTRVSTGRLEELVYRSIDNIDNTTVAGPSSQAVVQEHGEHRVDDARGDNEDTYMINADEQGAAGETNALDMSETSALFDTIFRNDGNTWAAVNNQKGRGQGEIVRESVEIEQSTNDAGESSAGRQELGE